MYLSAFFITVALCASFFVFEHAFPYFFGALLLWWLAIMKEVWGGHFEYTELSRWLWSGGNMLIGIGAADLIIFEIKKKWKKRTSSQEAS